jgi:hypothetical protein
MTILMVVMVTMVVGKGEMTIVARGGSPFPMPEKSVDEAMAQQTAADCVMGSFQESLEMKEKVDFLLTPAFLVQQVVSDGVVLTYPEE